jgi:endonuclease/exonuclease/phosphatase family metal-dependent hydrolase
VTVVDVEISVASINLHCGLTRDGAGYSVSDAVGELDADVVLVQENWRPGGDDSLARRAAAAHGYRGVIEFDLVADTSLADLRIIRGPVPDENGAWGLAILSRVPWQEYATVSLDRAPRDLGGERFAQIVELPMGGNAVLRVVNTHLTYRLAYGPAQVRRLMARLAMRQMPTVIGGDLNMCRPTIALAAPYRPAVSGRTWPAHRPIAQIDHLLVGPGVDVRDSTVTAELGSDHRAVRATVSLTGPARAREQRRTAVTTEVD